MIEKNDVIFISPTELELKPLYNTLKKFHIPHYVCGIGLVSSAFFLTRLLASTNYRLVILAGIGGIYKKFESDFDKLFLAQSEILADFARCSEDEIESIKIPDLEIEQYFSLKHHLTKYLSRLSDDFMPVDMATVSCASASFKRASIVQKRYDVVIENMEGASVAYVCKKFQVGLIELRSVSNIAGERNKALWQIDNALKRLTKGVELLLTSLENG